ncbi:DUF565 domain-containing protein [Synechococcus sp. A15-24]|uniref:DUF565 domain-containing protein n=1 Tax=Synechococcus sp. A15-24 TaxID=1050635 RepID=UPI0016454C43|nr:DUF565 domain-containing protein [Synechococcus sp. A15-24]
MGITERSSLPLFPPQPIVQPQSTRLQRSFGGLVQRLETWAGNPWRRLSLLSIAALFGFLVGSAITSVAGVLGQMDPVGALIVVLGTEVTVRLRSTGSARLVEQVLNVSRIGLLYGLFLEAFKLL